MKRTYIVNDHVIDLRNAATRTYYKPEVRLDERFIVVGKEKEKKEDLSFLIYNDDSTLLSNFVEFARRNGLSVAGDNSARVASNGKTVLNAKFGDVITVGLSSRFDVDVISTNDFNYNEQTEYSVYSLVNNEQKITAALIKLAEQKKMWTGRNIADRAMGLLPLMPTYRTLLAEKLGKKLLSKDSKQLTNKSILEGYCPCNRMRVEKLSITPPIQVKYVTDQRYMTCEVTREEEKKHAVEVLFSTPEVKTLKGSMIGSDFVKVGYDLYKIQKEEKKIIEIVEINQPNTLYKVVISNPYTR